MIRIGLLSDTHGYLDPALESFFSSCNEIWHAGDIGDPIVTDVLESWKPLKAVWGNIDTPQMRHRFPEHMRRTIEGLDVWMTHIGGYPGRYDRRVRNSIRQQPPGLFICGHSHILKVMPDKKLGLLHINPGAAGHQGFHLMRTAVRFAISDGRVQDLQVIELGKRGKQKAASKLG